MSPEIDADQPKESPAAPSDAVNCCCCVHATPLLTKAYAEPWSLEFRAHIVPGCSHHRGITRDRH